MVDTGFVFSIFCKIHVYLLDMIFIHHFLLMADILITWKAFATPQKYYELFQSWKRGGQGKPSFWLCYDCTMLGLRIFCLPCPVVTMPKYASLEIWFYVLSTEPVSSKKLIHISWMNQWRLPGRASLMPEVVCRWDKIALLQFDFCFAEVLIKHTEFFMGVICIWWIRVTWTKRQQRR